MKNLSKTLITFAILSVAGQAFAAPATTLEQRLQNLESQSRDQYSYNGDTSRKTRELERRINEMGNRNTLCGTKCPSTTTPTTDNK
ncbi:hypothetical protein [Vibrio breoganii]|uniref:hypothetical protein n=1 Tax=Vibrio breoganii TaxID=553239 RepID=UPI001F53DEA1|nr:hypothetical protein [Vibrio breoganii]